MESLLHNSLEKQSGKGGTTKAVGLNPEMGTPGLIYPSPYFFALILQAMTSTTMTENQMCFYSQTVGQTPTK